MPRKQHKYHYIYKTVNLITEKYYLGMHSTSNLEDKYLGSGKRLLYSIKKYGKENHKLEILEYLENRDLLKQREKEIINEEILKDPMCMNLVIGGEGGKLSDEFQRRRSSSGGKHAVLILANLRLNKEWNEKTGKSISIGLKKAILEGRHIVPSFINKKHSIETLIQMQNSHIGKHTGSKNSQFGTCWINNNGEVKKIKKEELNSFINNGWKKGRNRYIAQSG